MIEAALLNPLAALLSDGTAAMPPDDEPALFPMLLQAADAGTAVPSQPVPPPAGGPPLAEPATRPLILPTALAVQGQPIEGLSDQDLPAQTPVAMPRPADPETVAILEAAGVPTEPDGETVLPATTGDDDDASSDDPAAVPVPIVVTIPPPPAAPVVVDPVAAAARDARQIAAPAVAVAPPAAQDQPERQIVAAAAGTTDAAPVVPSPIPAQLPGRAPARLIQAAIARPAPTPAPEPAAAPTSIVPTATEVVASAEPAVPRPKIAASTLPDERRPPASPNMPAGSAASDPAAAAVDRQPMTASPAAVPGTHRPVQGERPAAVTAAPAAATAAERPPADSGPTADPTIEPATGPTALPAPVERAATVGAEAYGRTGTVADPVSQIMPRIVHATLGQRQLVSVDLHPAELGRVDIRITVDANRKVRATISAASVETVALLQRHVAGLETALTATGLTLAGDDAVTFDLGTSGGERERGAGRGDEGGGERSPMSPEPARIGRDEAATTRPWRRSRLEGVLDLVL